MSRMPGHTDEGETFVSDRSRPARQALRTGGPAAVERFVAARAAAW